MKFRVVSNTFPYIIDFSADYPDKIMLWDEMYDWCVETYGNPASYGLEDSDAKWIKQWNGIRFKTPEQVSWFMLRWS